MSEIQKHIESCRSEDPLAQTMEACGNESDIQAALQPLLVETMQGYEPVATTAPTSPIAELPGVLISIIRRVATKPLTILGERPAKQSLLGTLLDTWNAIRQRLSGNPSLGIPDRRADMSGHSLPTALALLSARKITGVPEAEDGIPLVRLLNDPSGITELTDDTEFVMTRSLSVKTAFPNVTKVTLGCTQTIQSGYSTWGGTLLGSDCEYHLPKLKKITPQATGVGFNQQLIFVTQTHDIYLPELEEIETGSSFGLIGGINSDVTDTPYMIYAPKLRKVGSGSCLFQQYNACKTGVWKVVLGTIETAFTSHSNSEMHTPNLIHFEFGEGTCASLNLAYWNPTAALDASRTDLIEQGSTAENNLQQFLLNFRDYIALRLADNGSGKTLTLSQAVYDTIKDESHLFVFDEGTMTIYAYLTNIKHWTVTK